MSHPNHVPTTALRSDAVDNAKKHCMFDLGKHAGIIVLEMLVVGFVLYAALGEKLHSLEETVTRSNLEMSQVRDRYYQVKDKADELGNVVDTLTSGYANIQTNVDFIKLASENLTTAYPKITQIFNDIESRNITAVQEEINKLRRDVSQGLNETERSELKMFFSEDCPPGWREYTITQGYLLVARPKGSTTGQRYNKPLGKEEKTRVGAHNHSATVHDPGHGHLAKPRQYSRVGDDRTHFVLSTLSPADTRVGEGKIPNDENATTGVTVSVEENVETEDYPLYHVLICQRIG